MQVCIVRMTEGTWEAGHVARQVVAPPPCHRMFKTGYDDPRRGNDRQLMHAEKIHYAILDFGRLCNGELHMVVVRASPSRPLDHVALYLVGPSMESSPAKREIYQMYLVDA